MLEEVVIFEFAYKFLEDKVDGADHDDVEYDSFWSDAREPFIIQGSF